MREAPGHAAKQFLLLSHVDLIFEAHLIEDKAEILHEFRQQPQILRRIRLAAFFGADEQQPKGFIGGQERKASLRVELFQLLAGVAFQLAFSRHGVSDFAGKIVRPDCLEKLEYRRIKLQLGQGRAQARRI